MIIDITRCRYAPGYLPKATRTFFNPFFATANMAVRREALNSIGEFDPACATGEDVDLSIRLSFAGWELWYEPSAVVQHQDYKTFRQLLRQWYGYGCAHPYVFRKHAGQARMQVYAAGDPAANSRPYGARCLLYLAFPFPVLVFITAYHLFHAALLALVIGILTHARAVTLTAGMIALAAFLYYATIRFDWRHPLRSLGMLALRYSADTSFVAGGFMAGLRSGTLFLHATRTR